LERDVNTLSLSEAQLKTVMQIYHSLPLHDASLMSKAKTTSMAITPHLVYRYLQSAEWKDTYHGRRINESIVDTIEWRFDYGVHGVHNLDTASIATLVERRLAYVFPRLDKQGRAVIYIRSGHAGPRFSTETYVRLLMYTVEQAEKLAVSRGSGEFVVISDLDGFKWKTVPPIGAMSKAIDLLKKHWPHRLAAVYVVKGGLALDILFGIFKPLLPKRTLKKIIFLQAKKMEHTLKDELGIDSLEQQLGNIIESTQEYFEKRGRTK
jgi:hypothetical protein